MGPQSSGVAVVLLLPPMPVGFEAPPVPAVPTLPAVPEPPARPAAPPAPAVPVPDAPPLPGPLFPATPCAPPVPLPDDVSPAQPTTNINARGQTPTQRKRWLMPGIVQTPGWPWDVHRRGR